MKVNIKYKKKHNRIQIHINPLISSNMGDSKLLKIILRYCTGPGPAWWQRLCPHCTAALCAGALTSAAAALRAEMVVASVGAISVPSTAATATPAWAAQDQAGRLLDSSTAGLIHPRGGPPRHVRLVEEQMKFNLVLPTLSQNTLVHVAVDNSRTAVDDSHTAVDDSHTA